MNEAATPTQLAETLSRAADDVLYQALRDGDDFPAIRVLGALCYTHRVELVAGLRALEMLRAPDDATVERVTRALGSELLWTPEAIANQTEIVQQMRDVRSREARRAIAALAADAHKDMGNSDCACSEIDGPCANHHSGAKGIWDETDD